jgi:hypothetical protein
MLAGVPVGLAAGLKILPGVLLLYFLATRRWRALAWACATWLLTLTVPAVLFGPTILARFAGHLSYFRAFLATWGNESLPGQIARYATGPAGLAEGATPPMPATITLLSAMLSIAVLGYAAWRASRLPPPSAYLALLLAVLLAAPIAWTHYSVWLLPFLIPHLAARPDALRVHHGLLVAGVLIRFLPLGDLFSLDVGPFVPWVDAALPWRPAGHALMLAALHPLGRRTDRRTRSDTQARWPTVASGQRAG